MQNLDYIEQIYPATGTPKKLIIWLHGFGADCNDFVPIIPELNLSECVKFVFPNAPLRPITINGGYQMRAWYDIKSLTELGNLIDYAGIKDSLSQIDNLITHFIADGWYYEQIFLVGFSQGGVMSYMTGLTTKHKLAGIIALSGYLPDLKMFDLNQDINNKEIPILSCHGIGDKVVSLEHGKQGFNVLKKLGYNITWHEYNMEHSLCSKELLDLTNWLNAKL